MTAMLPVGPVPAEERISALDIVRGFALFGILLMNIVGFGLWGAYDDPTVAGGAKGIDLWTWIVLHMLAEGKMRCIFSMVFGAGIILLTSRAEARGGSAADIYFRRNLWLMAFGVPHAYLLWGGDILIRYGLCALALYAFRRLEPRKLLAIGGVMLLIIAGFNWRYMLITQRTIAEGKVASLLESNGAKLSEEQQAAKKKWVSLRSEYKPTPAEVEKKNQKWRGSFGDAVEIRAQGVYGFHSLPYYHYVMLDMFSMMLFGMAFFRLGIFSELRSARFYAGTAATGYAIGLPLNAYTAYLRVVSNFDIVTAMQTTLGYDVGRLSPA